MSIKNILKNISQQIRRTYRFLGKKGSEFEQFYFEIIEWMIFSFLVVAIINLFRFIIPASRDVDKLISIAEGGIIIAATLTVLTFTYALTIESPKKEPIIKIGEYLFKATINFIIGIILLVGLSDALINPSNFFGLPDIVFDITIYINFLFLISGFAILIVSMIFFAKGITGLLESLKELK